VILARQSQPDNSIWVLLLLPLESSLVIVGRVVEPEGVGIEGCREENYCLEETQSRKGCQKVAGHLAVRGSQPATKEHFQWAIERERERPG